MNEMKQWKQLIYSQSLKKKWAISSSVVIFLSFTVMSIILYVALKGWLYEQEKQEVQRTMSDLTSFFESQGPFLTIKDIQSNTGLMTSIVDKEQTVRLLNADGIELLRINDTASFPMFDEIEIPADGYSLFNENASTISAIGNVELGRFHGYVQLEHPLNAFQSIMTYMLTALLLLSVCSLLLSGWIGYVLASYLLKPLQDLKLTMDDVAAHGFKKDLSIDYYAKDEIGELITVYESMMAKLKASFEQQQQFMADASHELRTPIQVVEGHLSLLNRWGKEDPEILVESLGISLREVHHMKILIDEMLELARGEQIKDSPRTNIVDLTGKVIEELTQVYPSAIIEHNPSQGEIEVLISSNVYQQILRNIITNAIRYSMDPAKVSISYVHEAKHVCICIQDQGIGIAQPHISKIFDRFYRVDAARSRDLGGSGLGLSIVKMLVEHASGSIDVASVEAEGTTFFITFPIN